MALPKIQDHLSNLQEAQRSTGDLTALDRALQHWDQCSDTPNFPLAALSLSQDGEFLQLVKLHFCD